MMPSFINPATWLTAIVSLAAAACVHAALPIDLEVAAQQDAPFGAMQEWGKLLAEMDLSRVRLRGAKGDDQPAIETTGAGAGKHYTVTAILTRGDVLVLPGGKFSQGDREKLKQFFQGLPERVEEGGVERGMFGLPLEEFDALLKDLSTPVGESTDGQRPEPMVAAIAAKLQTPLSVSVAARTALREAPLVGVELKGMASGTALAAVLRSANLAMIPEHSKTRPVTLRLVRLTVPESSWPVGWKPRGAPKQTAPAMYESTTVEIESYPLAQALEALAPHMGVPLVFDDRTLAAKHIDPAVVKVKFPAGKTYIRRAVDRILGQAQLAGELRLDDAGRPFYWMTQYGPESPHAKELVRAPASK